MSIQDRRTALGRGRLLSAGFWAATCIAILVCGACAEGVPTLGGAPVLDTVLPQSGSGGAGGTAGTPGFVGEPCTSNGASVSCSCAGGGEGTKGCLPDSTSPTGLAFSACSMCAPATSGGTGGVGSGGTSGVGSGGTSGVGSGGTSSGGTGGEISGDGGTCDVSACPMPTSQIPFVPAPAACCTTSGSCGAMDLFGGCA